MSASKPLPLGALDQQLPKLKAVLEERQRLIDEEIVESDEDSVEAQPTSPCRQGGRETGLRNVSVQAASGLGSGARGLSSESEWRRAFPRPPGWTNGDTAQ